MSIQIVLSHLLSIQGDLEEAAVQPVICVHACAVGCLIEHFPSRYGTPFSLFAPATHSLTCCRCCGYSNIRADPSTTSGLVVDSRHIQEGAVLHGAVQLVKYDKVPKHFRHRYLMSDLGEGGRIAISFSLCSTACDAIRVVVE